MLSNKDLLLAFIIGSSFFSFMVTFYYLGNAYNNAGSPKHIPIHLMLLLIPVFYGLANMLNMYLVHRYVNPNMGILVGLLVGLIFSLIGRFMFNLPITLFKFNRSNEHQVHLTAMILYAVIFRVIVTPLSMYYISYY